MEQPDFDKYLTELRQHIDGLRNTKGKEYIQGNNDVLANFKQIAQELGVDPLIIWYVYFRKHSISISSYIKLGPKVSTEPIEGRFHDAIAYLELGLALIKEKQANDQKDVNPEKN